ncbi:thiol:disulfide interchange protein DsbA [Sulfuricella denitrificans skB26]|uniref:Thiol:disulfide interchange protein n=1 Tax=Sulfuricella denitrificans (strain DSM 22764 / NBRC 105220 / skB26) TaxID=1163617 RepID=S6AL61_SULDS|nr:thiol:disulfide interchange protein DsbA/DsbL [Sulfuricella denitrificans]BAN35384.1 thiol:disulfide interchange protein DsbA [Sulfuricella denitrificans skB26]
MRLPIQNFVTSSIAILLGTFIVLSTVVAASPVKPEEGFDYQILSSPQPTKADGKIEVIEFFWYDCSHCNAMAPLIEPWAKRHRNSIDFKRIPVARNEGAILQQQLYYALESLGKVEELHIQIFNAIHDEWIPLKTMEQMADFLEKQGVGRNNFLKAINSAAVMKKVQRAQQLTAAYRVDSVPTIVVNGQYVTSASMIGGNQADVLPVVDYLVAKSKRRLP